MRARLILLALALAGCVSTERAPETAMTPAPESAAPARPVAGPDFGLRPDPSIPIDLARPAIDPRRTYSLPELIDIAQMANPATRSAWQRARQAAIAIGAVEATYLPMISADVIAGYQRSSQAVPGLSVDSFTQPGTSVTQNGQPAAVIIPSGTVTVEGSQVLPAVSVKWLLFDFGGRAADLEAARHVSTAANVSFNGTHQKLIFEVASAFFAHSAARTQLGIARDTVSAARLTLEAANARQGRGIATVIEVAQARQQLAQAEFGLTQSQGLTRDTYRSLLQAMGVAPTTEIRVQDISGRPLPRVPPVNLDRLVEASLRRRPDIQAAFARVRADQAGIARARSEFLPRVALAGNVGQHIGQYSISDSRLGTLTRVNPNSTNASVMLGLTMPLFDGGLRDARLRVAEAQAAAATHDLATLQNNAARQIVTTYDTLRTSLAGHAAASELTRAAQVTSTAALEYYRNGLGTLTEATAAQTALLQARLARAKAHSDALTAAAGIAFATGLLTNRDAAGR